MQLSIINSILQRQYGRINDNSVILLIQLTQSTNYLNSIAILTNPFILNFSCAIIELSILILPNRLAAKGDKYNFGFLGKAMSWEINPIGSGK